MPNDRNEFLRQGPSPVIQRSDSDEESGYEVDSLALSTQT